MKGVETKFPPNFIRTIVTEDVKAGKNGGKVLTRALFPGDPPDKTQHSLRRYLRFRRIQEHRRGGQ